MEKLRLKGLRKRTVFLFLLFASAFFVLWQFTQFTTFNQVIKGWLWGSEEKIQLKDVGLQGRQAQESGEIRHGESSQKDDSGQQREEEVSTNKTQLRKSRPTAWPMNSFLSPYHKHWDVNCSEILSGNGKVVKETNMMLKKLRDDNDKLPMPSDTEVN